MYDAALGTSASCLSESQMAEAIRLCNCKRYGLPNNPNVSGIEDAYQSVDFSSGPAPGCSPTPALPMPSDFNPSDPCEGPSRKICGTPRLRRPQQTAPAPPDKASDGSFEETLISSAAAKQQILVFGVLGLVLVGAGYLVYRSTRKKG